MPEAWGYEALKAAIALGAGGWIAVWLKGRTSVQKAQLSLSEAAVESRHKEMDSYRAEVRADLEEWRKRFDAANEERLNLKEKLSDVKIAYDAKLAELQRQIADLRDQIEELRETLSHCPNCPHREAAK